MISLETLRLLETVFKELEAAQAENRQLKESATKVANLHQPKLMAEMNNTTLVTELRGEITALNRELDRWRHGYPVEGDYVCPGDLRADLERDRANEAESRVLELETRIKALLQ